MLKRKRPAKPEIDEGAFFVIDNREPGEPAVLEANPDELKKLSPELVAWVQKQQDEHVPYIEGDENEDYFDGYDGHVDEANRSLMKIIRDTREKNKKPKDMLFLVVTSE